MRLSKLLLPTLVLALLAACAAAPAASNAVADAPVDSTIVKAETPDINSVHLRDNDEMYSVYDDSSVVTMYLTVSRGNSAEGTDHSWSEINHYSAYDYEAMGVDRYQVNALLQVGDENGPVIGELGYGETAPNATVQIRGQSSSSYEQKNYKIKLKQNKGTWRGQRTIDLNKHMSEALRFRNKMAYDLIEGIPQMMGLRTQFVHLYVKDLTASDDAAFEDYGLYTQVEQLNKTALQAHGLDKNGQLYKINFFEFQRYSDSLKLTSDPDYDQAKFEYYLEIKGNSDHTKLLDMLDTLNDTSVPIDDILDHYFDRENLSYWLAFQLLTGNADTQSRNAYLYSPLNSDTWYLLDWDNDGMLFRTENEVKGRTDGMSWEWGISNYWGNVLFRRALQSERFQQELNAAVEDLHDYLNADRINTMVTHYRTITEQYIWQMPDAMYEPVTPTAYDTIANSLSDEIENNYQQYYESYNYPMPFFMGVPQSDNGTLRLTWDTSYDFDAENLFYGVEVATDYTFQNVIFRQENLVLPEAQMDMPSAGQYFLRVRVTNDSGYTQDAFDSYLIDTGKVYGVKCFYVEPDGSIVEDEYVEN